MSDEPIKYRIRTNGESFRVQRRPRWWPFWCYVKTCYGIDTFFIREFESLPLAQDYIANERAEDMRGERKWTVV